MSFILVLGGNFYHFVSYAFLFLQLMNLLFSFLEPNRPHSALQAGYFSKVCLFCFIFVLFHVMFFLTTSLVITTA